MNWLFITYTIEVSYQVTLATYISKLDHAQFSQLTDAAVGCLRLEKELSQGHLLTPEQFPHDDLLTPPQLEWRNTAGHKNT